MDLPAAKEVLAGLPGSIVALDVEAAIALIKILDSDEVPWSTLQVSTMHFVFLVAYRLPRLLQASGLQR